MSIIMMAIIMTSQIFKMCKQ